MTAEKNPGVATSGASNDLNGSDCNDSSKDMSLDAFESYELIEQDLKDSEWSIELLDVASEHQNRKSSFFAVLTRRVVRANASKAALVSESRAEIDTSKGAVHTGQSDSVHSGQNIIWECRMAGPDRPAIVQPRTSPGGDEIPASTEESVSFRDLPTMKAMGTGDKACVIGFDTEFTEKGEKRVIDSYQFCVVDPEDDSILIDVVILPLQGQRILLEDALSIVVKEAGLWRLVDGLADHRGVVRRDFWVASEPKKSRDRLFKSKLRLVLAGHFLNADLTAFERPASQRNGGEKYHDVLRHVTSASGGLVSLQPMRIVHKSDYGRRWLPISLIVRDTMGQVADGHSRLEDLGHSCGVEKIELKESVIENMSRYRRLNLVDFLEYGVNDAHIVVEYLAILWGLHAVPPVTISGGGARALKDGVSRYLGIESGAEFRAKFQGLVVRSSVEDSDDGLSYYAARNLTPVDGDANAVHSAFKDAYHGGLNSCPRPGYFSDLTYDHDIQSAYPSAMASIFDVDYEAGVISSVIRERELTLDDFPLGCVTPLVAFVGWEFPQGVEPCLPVKVEQSIIYPRTSEGVGASQGEGMCDADFEGFSGAWCAGPELYLALKLGARVTCQMGYSLEGLTRMVSPRCLYALRFGKW